MRRKALGHTLTLLERRLAPALFTVTTAADAGAGSLRQAIDDANLAGTADTIAFSVGTGPITITPHTNLPDIIDEVIIDGTTQPGFAGKPIVEIDGGGLAADGLVILADNCTVRGLVVNDFGQSGIYIQGAGNVVAGNFIGTDLAGTAAAGNANSGVYIDGGTDNLIGGSAAADRNVLSGNGNDGVTLVGFAANNFVQGNLIGTDVTGAKALGNGLAGVAVVGASVDNLIGTDADGANDAAERNVLSGNGTRGVVISGPGVTGNVVAGNHIGTDLAGTAAVPNDFEGVIIDFRSAGNRVGGAKAGEGNLISGNTFAGVFIPESHNNAVEGNRIGTDTAGAKPLPNGSGGVWINNGSTGNRVGGGAAGAGNVISGNDGSGVVLADPGTTGNFIQGNRIGTDAAGTAKLPNTSRGVDVFFRASGNVIGTDADGTDDATEGNLISGNGDHGVGISSDLVDFRSYVWTAGNGNTYVVTPVITWPLAEAAAAAAGGHLASVTSALEQAFITGTIQTAGQFPEDLWIGANDVAVEGTFAWTTGEPFGFTNWAAGQPDNAGDEDFVHLFPDGTWNDNVGFRRALLEFTTPPNPDVLRPFFQAKGNVVAGNLVGTDVTGTKALGNTITGVLADQGTSATLVGGTAAVARNVISGNSQSGVGVFGLENSGTIVRGNYIGTDVNGAAAVPNGGDGVQVDFNGGNAVIGGTAAGAGNLISGNAFSGVAIRGRGNVVEGNRIGTDAAGTADLGNNDFGVLVAGGAQFNRVGGGGAASAGNLISGNGATHVAVFDRGTRFNAIQGNRIGTDAAGAAALPGAFRGVEIGFGAADNLVGSNADGLNDAGERNLISGHGGPGVSLFNGSAPSFQVFQWTGGNGNYYVLAPNAPWTESETVAVAAGGHLASITSAAEQAFVTGTILAGANDKAVVAIALTDAAAEGKYSWTTGEPFAFTNWQTGQPFNDRYRDYAVANDGWGFGYLTDPAEKGKWAAVGDGYYQGLLEFTAPPDLALLDRLYRTHDNVIAGNFIGTDDAGTKALPNGQGGVAIFGGAVDTTVGGSKPAARNVISGNVGDGVGVFDAETKRTRIEGNHIGTDPAGTLDVGNIYRGVGLFFEATDVTVVGNLISGNDYGGIDVNTAMGAVIRGNHIGTDAAGTNALGNGTASFSDAAIVVRAGAVDTVIGGGAAGAGNLISGNFGAGVAVYDHGTTGTVIAGNRIGTDPAGAAKLPNGARGIDIGFGASDVRIGTDADGVLDLAEANVIGGHAFDGIGVFGGLPAAPFEVFQWTAGNGNYYVVTPATRWNLAEAAAVAAGGHVVSVNNAAEQAFINGTIQAKYPVDLWIGLTDSVAEGTFLWTDPGANPPAYFNWAAGEPNNLGEEDVVVLTPAGPWVDVNLRNYTRAVLEFTSPPNLATLDALFRTRNVTIAGNFIGTDASGTADLGNGFGGVYVEDSLAVVVGGVKAAESNTVAFNGFGVAVNGPAAAGVRVRGNAIRGNSGLGLDLGNNGVTANDPGDADVGPNGLQNFPTISVANSGPTTRVIGTLNSVASKVFTVDFYASAAADPSGFGEGGRYLGSTTVNTDGTGNGAFDASLAAASMAGEFVTATATDAGGNTSEFSLAKVGVNPPKVSSVVVNNGANQRSRVTSITVTFDQIVTLPGSPETAFAVDRQAPVASVTLAAAVNNSGPGTVVTLTFTGGAVNANSLADGRYTLTAFAAKVSGGTLDGDSNGAGGDNFVLVGSPGSAPRLFRFFGDNDGDGDVDAVDYGQFRGAFGGSSNLAFDFDGDGDVDAVDLGAFRPRFGSSV